jgi:hypothetical protein
MKKINLSYWIITIIFAGFMIFTAVPDLLLQDKTKSFITMLGYPPYFAPFIDVAKIIGSIAICIPAFKRIKEWAYAGLFFDLAGATYSVVIKYGVDVSIVFMLLPMVFLFASYFLWHKKMAMV